MINTLAPTAATWTSAASAARGGERARSDNAGERQDHIDPRAVTRMQQRDREVRAHEMAHMAAGAGLVRGGASYSFERGPDGRLYAVGGEVSIDTSPGRTPEETIERAARIRAAALAPADPSAQDHRVAAAASQMEMTARVELARGEGGESAAAADTAAKGAAESRRPAFGAGLEPAKVGGLIDTFA